MASDTKKAARKAPAKQAGHTGYAKAQRLWREDTPGMRKIRDRWLNDVACSTFACNANTKEGDLDRGIPDPDADHRHYWNAHWLDKNVSLELMYPPKKCVEIMIRYMQARVEDYQDRHSGAKDPEDLTMSCNVRQVGEVLEKNGDVFLSCTLETNLKIGHFENDVYNDMADQFMQNGVPFHDTRFILPWHRDDPIQHTFDAILVNPPIRSLENQSDWNLDRKYCPMDHKQILQVYADDNPAAIDGFRERDMMAYIRQGNWSNLPLDGLKEGADIPDLEKCQPKTRAHIRKVFLSHKMGILGKYPRILNDYDRYIVPYGKIAMPISRKGKGLLPTYRKLLRDSGKWNPGAALGSRGNLDPDLERYNYRTTIGFVQGSLIQATSHEQTSKSWVRHRLMGEMGRFEKTALPKKIEHVQKGLSR